MSLHVYTLCIHQNVFIIIALCICPLTHIGEKKELRTKNSILSFVFAYLVTFTSALYFSRVFELLSSVLSFWPEDFR